LISSVHVIITHQQAAFSLNPLSDISYINGLVLVFIQQRAEWRPAAAAFCKIPFAHRESFEGSFSLLMPPCVHPIFFSLFFLLTRPSAWEIHRQVL
jgi:hypothetical protein